MNHKTKQPTYIQGQLLSGKYWNKHNVKCTHARINCVVALPTHWDSQPTGTNGKQRICHVVTLDMNSQEYNYALKTFQMTLPPSQYEIIAVKRIQNPQLYRKYVSMKADMKDNCLDGCQLERELFHGTAKNTCEAINHQGFNKIFAGKNGKLNV